MCVARGGCTFTQNESHVSRQHQLGEAAVLKKTLEHSEQVTAIKPWCKNTGFSPLSLPLYKDGSLEFGIVGKVFSRRV